MNFTKLALAALTLLVLFSCKNTSEKGMTSVEEVRTVALVPDSWVTERVEKAKQQLASSEAGQIIWQGMEAHGGLQKWYANGPISFQFDYQPRDKGARRNTMQVVDTWSNRSVHHAPENTSARFGWDGSNAWVTPADTASFGFDLRFWALTPIYFLAQPFNFDGAGVILEKLGDKTLEDKVYDAVKISFASGTGDAPDDYYINYFDKNTHQLHALRYIVSYPKYFKDGGHSPEKIMTLHDYTTVDGITLPTSYKTYMLGEDEQLGEYVTDIQVSKISFEPETKDSYFSIPEGMTILD